MSRIDKGEGQGQDSWWIKTYDRHKGWATRKSKKSRTPALQIFTRRTSMSPFVREKQTTCQDDPGLCGKNPFDTWTFAQYKLSLTAKVVGNKRHQTQKGCIFSDATFFDVLLSGRDRGRGCGHDRDHSCDRVYVRDHGCAVLQQRPSQQHAHPRYACRDLLWSGSLRCV